MKGLIYNLLKKFGINPPDAVYSLLAAKKMIWTLLDKGGDSKNLMVNIGGTRFYKRHWKIMDYRHPETRHYDFPGLDYNFDLTSGKPFPFADDSVYLFYSSHTLEHIAPKHAQHILNEIHRCLRPGGGVRLTMPDYDSLWAALGRRDWDSIVNIGGDPEADRFRGAVLLYGFDAASKLLRGWPQAPRRVKPPHNDQKVADYFVGDFAGHHKGITKLDEIVKLSSEMTKEQLADHYCMDVSEGWKAGHPQEHSNWWNYDKLSSMLRQAGFNNVYRSEPFKSHFEEMVGVSKYWSFDHIRMDTGLYVEAMKDA